MREHIERRYLEKYGTINTQHRKEIDASVARVDLEHNFQLFIGTFGFPQYLLAPLAFLLSLIFLIKYRREKWPRAVAIGTLTVSALCIFMMFYRSYFFSVIR